jgi:hypothetical protein
LGQSQSSQSQTLPHKMILQGLWLLSEVRQNRFYSSWITSFRAIRYSIDHAPNVSALIRGASPDLPRGVTPLLWLPASIARTGRPAFDHEIYGDICRVAAEKGSSFNEK